MNVLITKYVKRYTNIKIEKSFKKNSVKVLSRNNVPGFESIKLINSKRQPPNLKKLLNKTEFGNEEIGVRKC